ncbi:hypothetical protein BVRB_4g072170 isoform A [Beta vulgaris subsp. vulgaris]|uniref:uncharacterized protein LOC104889943 n=1 Tax=Beta vulgaris subsp. vulgaris TaxID=3555 RepID=UPI00053FA3F0|nr:uncharacterized protein LOC104889943 [Beta vulgaris subsp. vulgaris]KMT14441.1 hypothetical protein BVRB_4g072170 isoform A [Beta vulgaris subsp. vulgaris]
MDRYVVPTEPSSSNPKPIRRPRWRRTAIELNGCMESKYKREMCGLLVQSYSQIGVFTHLYHIDGRPCRTHMDRVLSFAGMDIPLSSRRHGISALEFDNQGIYVASVTKSGCLMVHEFESLYCQSNVISPWWKEDETKHLLHISTSRQLDSVRWNSANQDEVACASLKSSEILIYDIGYVSSDPVDILKKRPSVTIHGSDIITGLSDVAFTSTDDSRVFASDTNGSINIWDRRGSTFPSVQLTTNSSTALNSIQLNVDNQIVFGAGKQGMIYMWDLRGGRTSAAFQNHKEAYHPPMASVKVSSLLEKIEILKAQSHIVPKDIHSINLDPSSPYRLAFHLDDGWSGILDIHSLEVTHIHCPPPAWLTGSDITNLSYMIKPSWLSTNSIYAVGSSSDKGLHLLDFHPDPGSPCHVDCSEEMANISRRNGFVPLSEDVSACAAHPLNGFIVAGTKQASLLMIGQRKKAVQGDEEGLLTHQDNE